MCVKSSLQFLQDIYNFNLGLKLKKSYNTYYSEERRENLWNT